MPETGEPTIASENVVIYGNVDFHAYWSDDYVVTFDPNGGTCDEETRTVKYGN